MDFGKQTRQARFEIATPSGSTVSTHTVKLQHWNLTWKPEWFGDMATDKALSGNKRSNWKGFDASLSIRWDHTVEEDTIKAVINALKVAVDNHNDIYFSIVGVADKKLKVIPSEGIEFAYEYQNTIGKVPVTIALEVARIKDQISYD